MSYIIYDDVLLRHLHVAYLRHRHEMYLHQDVILPYEDLPDEIVYENAPDVVALPHYVKFVNEAVHRVVAKYEIDDVVLLYFDVCYFDDY